jgi:peptidoglycan/LPS O-acetylase OafA/YrhL
MFGKLMTINDKMSSNMRKFTGTFVGIFRSILLALLPSYILRRLRNEPSTPIREFPTAYLNGFRGLMAFLVFVRHFSLPWQPDMDYGFGQGENHTGVLRLPVLRMLYAGPNVPVFLIVSGFVMSLKPLKLLNSDQKETFHKSMVSSVFRRAIRIFPPPILSTFVFMLAVHFRLFKFQYNTMDKFIPHHPDSLPTIFGQFTDWLQFVFGDLTNPWSWKSPKSAYGGHLWTIGLQFRSLMVLFLALIGLSNTRKQARQAILALLFIYCMCSGRCDVALYLSGMFMAGNWIGDESKSNLAVASSFDLEKVSASRPAVRFRSRIYWCLVLLAGLYLSSYPRARDGVGAPWYRVLYSISPYYLYWQGCGAVLLVWSLICSKTAQKPLNWSFPQYLGEISYSLYIVHEPLLHVLGYGIVNVAWNVTGKDTGFQYQLGFSLGLLLTTPILLVSENNPLVFFHSAPKYYSF